MVDITQIDHVTEGLDQLPSNWEDKPVIRGVLKAWLTPLNQSEEGIIATRDSFNVNTAVGYALDIIGGYFDERRQGRSDIDYRNTLLSRVSSSNGSGTPNQILDLFNTLSGTTDVTLWEHYPLSMVLYAKNSLEVSIGAIDYLNNATAAGVEYGALLYDKNDWAWIPADKSQSPTLSNLISSVPDNVIMNDGVEDFNVGMNLLVEEVDDGTFRSSFVDQSIPEPEETGYGQGYGNSYGGITPITSILVEASLLGNPLTPSGGNGYLLWAETELYDPDTGTTNKAEPIPQVKDTGLKRRQPLARQFFNWMMASLDDWFSFVDKRVVVGTIKITDDVSKTISDYATLFGGTWTARGSEVYTMTGGVNATETVYIFERTV